MEKRIIEFLIKAKQATYAGKGAETASSRVKSHDLVYRDGEYMYYDTYLGGEKFAGEEALWISEIPYWSMNYVGRVIGDHFSGGFSEGSAASCSGRNALSWTARLCKRRLRLPL